MTDRLFPRTDLSAAVDVYAAWIDACDDVAKQAAAEEAADKRFSSYATGPDRVASTAADPDADADEMEEELDVPATQRPKARVLVGDEDDE